MASLAVVAGGVAGMYTGYKLASSGSPGDAIEGRVCLITGAGGGVGTQAALAFALEGCTLVLWDLDEAALQATREAVAKISSAPCWCQVVDISDPAAVYSAAEIASASCAPAHVSILVNNAGIVAGKAFLETDDARILKTFQVNALSHFYTVRAFLPAMISRHQGHIVTVASAAGLTAAAMMVPYGASKHASVGFGHGLRKELKVMGHSEAVRTSLICPAHIKTNLFKGFKQPLMPSLKPEYVAAQIVQSVRKRRQYVVLPGIADPSFLHTLFPVWLQDKIESLVGLDSMMASTDLGHADTIVGEMAKQTKSKL